MLKMNRRCRLAGVDLIFDLCFMYRLQTGTTPGILVIINFLTGQFISFRVFSSLNQMYILENKFQDFNFLPSIDDVCGNSGQIVWRDGDIWCDLLWEWGEWEQSDINCCCYWPPQTHGVSSPSSQFPVFNVGRTQSGCAEKVLQLLIIRIPSQGLAQHHRSLPGPVGFWFSIWHLAWIQPGPTLGECWEWEQTIPTSPTTPIFLDNKRQLGPHLQL